MQGLTAPIQHVHLNGILWLIPVLPLVGATINAFFGVRIQRSYGKKAIAAIAVGFMVMAALLAAYELVALIRLPAEERFLLDHCWTMWRIGALDVNFDLAMDPLSALMTMIITWVGAMIHIYASSYMESEPSYWRFFCYLNLFIFSMLLLVLGDNFFVMFFGWEGVGLCSYLLIGFWWKDYKKATAGMKAFVVNRVGDWGFVVGLMLLFWSMGGSWGIPNGMDVEYTRRNPQPVMVGGAMDASDLDPDGAANSVGPSIYPVRVTESGHGEHEGAHEGLPPGMHGPSHEPGHGPSEKHDEDGLLNGPIGDQLLASDEPAHVALPSGIGAKGSLTMTAYPGARVFLGGGYVTPDKPCIAPGCLVTPFVMHEVGAGLVDVEIEVQPWGAKMRMPHVSIPSGGEVSLSVVGPTVSFRQLRDEFSMSDGASSHFIRKMMDPSVPGHKTVWGVSALTLACICFFVGATGKSAQIPLYVWLPDAMAGPTPVSALIHAATMVTAGVYMIARLSFLFSLSPTACAVVASVGAATALFAATIGFFQMDIKKVLAYSTVSQLGFMFIGVGVGAYWAGVFHLMTHAFFKACLFLGSGSVIHGMHAVEHDEVSSQDMRNMGGLKKVMPQTARTYFIACLAITAAPIPLFAGFWSKDEILWKAFTSENLHTFQNGFPLGKVIYFVGLAAAMCTSFYMWRSYYLTFEGEPRKKDVLKKVHESPVRMTAVLWVLAGLSTVGGVFFGINQHFLGMHLGPEEPLLESWLHPVVDHVTINGPERATRWTEAGSGMEMMLMALSVGLALLSWYVARQRYGNGRAADWDAREAKAPGYTLTQNKYYVDEIYQATIIALVLRLRMLLSNIDKYIVDGLVNFTGVLVRAVAWTNGMIDRVFVDGAVRFVSEGLLAVGARARRLQTGKVQNYILAALGGVAIFALIAQLLR